jgi:polyisoprenoid-binding protein YceI
MFEIRRKLSACIAIYTLFISCQSVPKAELSQTGMQENVKTGSGITYVADTSKTIIEWIGTKPVGKHHGTLKLSEGKLFLSGDSITGGRFTIRIGSLQPDDKKSKSNEMLKHHLLSDDFFDALKYPFAVFEITEITRNANGKGYTVKGNLALKGVTKSISFPASITLKHDMLDATANFNFDRTIWNMNYGNDKSLGNWFINPIINIRLHFVAGRQR